MQAKSTNTTWTTEKIVSTVVLVTVWSLILLFLGSMAFVALPRGFECLTMRSDWETAARTSDSQRLRALEDRFAQLGCPGHLGSAAIGV